MKRQRKRRFYPKDIGLRFCITCARETKFKWSDSNNTWICEQCDYETAMGKLPIDSEAIFLDRLNKNEIP